MPNLVVRDKIIHRLSRPASEGAMASLCAHILVALETRETLKLAQPTILPLSDSAILGLALAQWLGGDAKDVVAALRGEGGAQP